VFCCCGCRGSIAAVGAGQQEVVEIISQNEGMRSALKRLCDVLTPFLNEENTDVSTRSAAFTSKVSLLCAVAY
jgi:hypothetical protein